ncbi:hypothetical protein BK025_05250 [Sodalis sp. TME1]|nr:hypothetical protein BK025_05250 [Sodalis sp. TME1]
MSTGHYELQKVRNGHFLFHLKGNNGETILHSETFSSKASAENAITFARYVAPDETNYELKQNNDDAAYFVLRGKNQQIIGHSDPYNSLKAAKQGIRAAMALAITLEIKDMTH